MTIGLLRADGAIPNAANVRFENESTVFSGLIFKVCFESQNGLEPLVQ